MNEAMHTEVRIGEYGRLQVNFFQDMLRELGSEINTDTLILDFGCGEGGIVYHLRKQGFKAFGVDIVKDYENVQKRCEEEGLVEADEDAFRLIDMSNYKIPFDDNTFDVIISDQVFEHVQNYPEALAEIKRILKPGGSSLHIIPFQVQTHRGAPFYTVGRNISRTSLPGFVGIIGCTKFLSAGPKLEGSCRFQLRVPEEFYNILHEVKNRKALHRRIR